MQVLKRNKKAVKFDINKIKRAIELAYSQVDNSGAFTEKIDKISKQVKNIVTRLARKQDVTVEDIQDLVEKQLMADGDDISFEAAKAYILHRQERAALRGLKTTDHNNLLKNFIFTQKYARYNKKESRRETFEEAVDRVERMHLKKYKDCGVEADIKKAFALVRERKVLPSMRSMQFGGKPIEINNLRLYNCSATPLDDYIKFAEILYVLLCGVGVGWSVEYEYVNKLPKLVDSIDTGKVKHHIVDDSIEGWADAIKVVMESYFKTGEYVELSYHKIRPQGSQLRTSGGKAPGHLGLKLSIEKIRKILDNRLGRKLRPIDCHDICCFLSDAVLSGGIRRSAAIALFSVDDVEMMTCKTGQWLDENPQRARANNSCRLISGEYTEAQVKRLLLRAKEFGEPGLFFVSERTVLTNPCGEITMTPFINKDTGEVDPDGETGFGFCNLTEVNVAACSNYDELFEAVVAATIIGTLQAGFTDFPYLRKNSSLIAKRDALLGVSLTGIMDNYSLIFKGTIQTDLAKTVLSVNKVMAAKIGINPAKRCTTVKPSGTASIVLGCISNGIHPRHSKRYFRRSQQNIDDPVYKYFKSFNPHMCEKSLWSSTGTDEVITFCIKAPDDAKTRDDFTAIELLEHVVAMNKGWIKHGSEGKISHNISNTITVKEHEWPEVIDFVWKHRRYLSGVSFFAYSHAKGIQTPFEAVEDGKDEKYWRYLLDETTDVDFTQLKEKEDNTKLKEEVACAGGACSII